MSYASIVEMTQSPALQARIAACAADEGMTNDPQLWARNNIWAIVSDPAWVSAWDYARNTPNQANFNPDTGARDDVIDDEMILAAVGPMVNPPVPPETEPPT